MIRIMTDGVIPNTQNKKYIIETASELSQLEAVFGNEAYCIGNETTYICNGSGTYVVKKNVGENELPYVTQSDNGTLLEVADGTWGKGANANEIARVDGHYENLGAGRADQLVSTTFAEDSVPYSFRTSGGSADVGDLEYDEIVGGTIAWNQLMSNGNFTSTSSWGHNRCDVSVADNIGTFTANDRSDQMAKGFGGYCSIPVPVGHYVLVKASFAVHTSNQPTQVSLSTGSSRPFANIVGNNQQDTPINDTWYDLSFIAIANDSTYSAPYVTIYCSFNSSSDITAGTDTLKLRNVTEFDLTQMFDPTIASYIYQLEHDNAGEGVAFFNSLFPKAYYEHNTGELMSVRAASHKMIGFNAWDEVWENGYLNNNTGANVSSSSNIRSQNFIRVIPGMTYSIECPSGFTCYLFYYDGSKNYLGRWDANHAGTFTSDGSTVYRTIPENCCYVRFYYNAASYNNDFCIHLKWSGYRDGEYEAYKERVYPLDSSLELQGVPKIDSSNRVYYDGDIYKSDGSVTHRFYKVSSADCTVAEYVAPRWRLTVPSSAPTMLTVVAADVANICVSKYFTVKAKSDISDRSKYSLSQTDGASARRSFMFTIDSDEVTTVEDAVAWVSEHPFEIIYEVDTPTTATAASFISPQWVDDFGTEEYVDYGVQQGDRDVSIPVGHNTKYLQNLRDKLQHLPNLPDPLEDGDYKIHVSGHQMSLIPDGGVVNVHLTYDSINENYRSDLTIGEISELIQNGMRVHLLFEIPDYYPGFEYNAPVGLVVKSNETYDPERTLYELMAQIVDPQSRYIVLLDTMGVTSDETQWYMRLYPLGCTDVVFDGTYNSSTGNFSWDCDATNAEIVNLLDKYGSVRAKIYIDLMNDTYMYFTQCTVQNDLVHFCGIATLPNNGANQLSYIQLHQSSEDTWVSTITPLQ